MGSEKRVDQEDYESQGHTVMLLFTHTTGVTTLLSPNDCSAQPARHVASTDTSYRSPNPERCVGQLHGQFAGGSEGL